MGASGLSAPLEAIVLRVSNRSIGFDNDAEADAEAGSLTVSFTAKVASQEILRSSIRSCRHRLFGWLLDRLCVLLFGFIVEFVKRDWIQGANCWRLFDFKHAAKMADRGVSSCCGRVGWIRVLQSREQATGSLGGPRRRRDVFHSSDVRGHGEVDLFEVNLAAANKSHDHC